MACTACDCPAFSQGETLNRRPWQLCGLREIHSMGRLSGVSAAGVFEAPMITPELDAIMAMRVCQAAMDRDPELVP
jgi:hypothetical protein